MNCCHFKAKRLHYENTPIQIYRNFHLQKLKIFRYKKIDIFHMSAQNIDCGYSLEPPRRGGSNEYPQSMFLSRDKKIIYNPINPRKWGLRGSTLYRHVFVMKRHVTTDTRSKKFSTHETTVITKQKYHTRETTIIH